MRADLTRVVLELQAGGVFALDAARGWTLQCESGRIWVTESLGGQDVMLAAGDSHQVRHRGKVLLESREAARIRLFEGEPGGLRFGAN